MKKTSSLRFIGIDPGTNITGYGVIEIASGELKLLDLGVITMQSKDEHPEKLKDIFQAIQALVNRFQPHEMAIEAPFYSKNIQSMLKLGRAQGVVMAAAMVSGIPVTEYAPRKVKQSITGKGNATKEQVAAMLKHILGTRLEETLPDATDALAVAICHYYQHSSITNGSKRYKDWSAFLKDNPTRNG
ncbi:MAG: hypothetical protein RLY31_2808 [Bacteroidota bacterium]|jgi:crossover junction endodeoxyribonuclease RuvC